MDLRTVLSEAIQPYAGEMLNGFAYLTISIDQSVYSVVSVAKLKSERVKHLSLLVRVVGETVIIEHDDTDQPLIDALLHAGIPRSQIILAYAGEPVPDSAEGAA